MHKRLFFFCKCTLAAWNVSFSSSSSQKWGAVFFKCFKAFPSIIWNATQSDLFLVNF
jgi:hypothetical protein